MQERGVRRGHDQADVVQQSQLRALVVHLVHRPGIRPPGRKDCAGALGVRRRDVELHHRPGRGPGNRAGDQSPGRDLERPALPRAPVPRPVQPGRGDPLRIRRLHGDGHRLVGGGHDGLVPEVGEGGAEVRLCGGISGPGCAIERRHRQPGGPRNAVEVEARVQLVVSRQPPGPEGNLVFPSIHDRPVSHEGGLQVIVHVLGRAGGDEIQDMVARLVRIGDHVAEAVGSEEPPGGGAAFEIAVRQQRHRCARGGLDDLQVVDQAFPGVEQAEHEFVPAGGSGRRLRDGSIGVIAPT